MKHTILMAAIIAGGTAMSAHAAEYYLTSRFMSEANIGEIALAVDINSLRNGDGPGKIADIASVSASNRVVTVFTIEVDCNAHAWRILSQKDYRTDNLVAPTSMIYPQPAFTAVEKGSENGKAIDLVCGWPGSASNVPASARYNVLGPVPLAEKIAPTLRFQLNDPTDRAFN